ncbi:hypothetical protein [Desulfosporosinus meridiei]|uniref:Uncharacterized protein n=1 Tax=Desulfosporosinus meridiei (strain ATCC BAA-275 / DSM 13257 / KCTC 12902 / NCIMB 13706 / S10) TaxID=768704 RepID=J7IYD8_DESMD|nr:hypothetical protein [Desulfosporosinus meridiei]AFQ45159.1 hypothetical protein Desmer_3282 [Desulfosporosinus meridiei DSM 13257]
MVKTEKRDKQLPKIYSKQQILKSKQYFRKDLLEALLEEGQKYSHDQVKKILEDFLKREAK